MFSLDTLNAGAKLPRPYSLFYRGDPMQAVCFCLLAGGRQEVLESVKGQPGCFRLYRKHKRGSIPALLALSVAAALSLSWFLCETCSFSFAILQQFLKVSCLTLY